MVVYSLCRDGYQLKTLQVELKLIPGLPAINILGLPDQTIKESGLRIRSAFRSLNLPFPKAQQVIVNLKPNHVRKRSRGIEFAIAAALLWELGYAKRPSGVPIVYGELNLNGEVETPEDISDLIDLPEGIEVWAGHLPESVRLSFSINKVTKLDLIDQSVQVEASETTLCQPAPQDLDELLFSKGAADFLALVAAGEHHCLLAGPPGGGKTTLAQAIHRLLPPVKSSVFRMVRSIHRFDGQDVKCRPFIAPHHTSTHVALVGGGAHAKPGDFTRAHGGILLLDEYLQFHPRVLESLREPFESGTIRVSRNTQSKMYPAKALVLATSNLCPCGKWLPGKPALCSLSMRRCRSRLDRLSGPMLDRFSIVYFPGPGVREESLSDVRVRVNQARGFAENTRRQKGLNSEQKESLLETQLEDGLLSLLPKVANRRHRSLLQVARTLADLHRSPQIRREHIVQAMKYAVTPFDQLLRGMP